MDCHLFAVKYRVNSKLILRHVVALNEVPKLLIRIHKNEFFFVDKVLMSG